MWYDNNKESGDGMKFGFAQKQITPKRPCYLAGYAAVRPCEQIHDELYVKVLLWENAQHKLYGIAAFDLLAVDHLLRDAICARCKEAKLPIAHLFCSAIHTHSAPMGILDSEHGFLKSAQSLLGKIDEAYIADCAQACAEAMKEAYAHMEEGVVETAGTHCAGIGSNRNDQALLGNDALWLTTITLSKQKALLVNFACHPTILQTNNHACSADYCGAYAKAMEAMGYSVCLFLNGSCGDISSRFTRKGSDFAEVERMGRLLADQSAAALNKRVPWVGDEFDYRPFTIILRGKEAKRIEEAQKALAYHRQQAEKIKTQPCSAAQRRTIESAFEGAMADYLYAKYDEGIREYAITVEMLRIGSEIFIGIPGELFSELSNPYQDEHTHFISYMNGYYMYFANAHAYEQQYYEAASSPFAKGESERMMDMIYTQIKKWRNE